MANNEYIWLDLVGDVAKEVLVKLNKIYINEYRIYLATFCPSNFRKVLINNNVEISKATFKNMIDLDIKRYSIIICEGLKKEGVELIGLLQDGYPIRLREQENPPIAIYMKTNSKESHFPIHSIKPEFANMYKLYMLEGKNEFNKEILDYIWTKTINRGNKIYPVSNGILLEYRDSKNIEIENNRYIGVCKIGDIDIYVLNNKNGYVDKEKILLGIIDGIVVARVSNIERGLDIVDYILDGGGDIFAVPGNILYKENYLSNHLIKQGAYVVTNKYDMKNLI